MQTVSITEQKAKGRFLIVTTALLWGLAGVCVKSITWSSLSISAVRTLVSLCMLLAAKKSLKVTLSKINLAGGFFQSITSILYLSAIKMTTAGTAIVLQYVAPIVVFLFEVIFCKRKFRLYEAVLTGLVFVGILLSFADSIDMTHLLGNCIALLSGITFAAQIILMNRKESDSKDVLLIGHVFSLLFCTPFLFLDPAVSFTAKNLFWLFIVSVFQYGLANILFSKGCKLIDDVECSLLLTIEPVFNPIPVAIFCGEVMGPKAILGAAVVIIAVTLYAVYPKFMEKRKQQAVKNAPGTDS